MVSRLQTLETNISPPSPSHPTPLVLYTRKTSLLIHCNYVNFFLAIFEETFWQLTKLLLLKAQYFVPCFYMVIQLMYLIIKKGILFIAQSQLFQIFVPCCFLLSLFFTSLEIYLCTKGCLLYCVVHFCVLLKREVFEIIYSMLYCQKWKPVLIYDVNVT